MINDIILGAKTNNLPINKLLKGNSEEFDTHSPNSRTLDEIAFILQIE